MGVSTSGQFSHVSFVNSINTSRGGTHVNYITDQITKYLVDLVNKKDKELKINTNHVKVRFSIRLFTPSQNHLSVFVNCLIENPAFDSQTKETLTTKATHFGSGIPLIRFSNNQSVNSQRVFFNRLLITQILCTIL